MFNAKKPDGTHDTSVAAYSATASSNARPFAAHVNADDANCSIINEWLTMRGDLESEGDILVKGKIHGNIQCKLLIIDAEAIVEGAIVADEVVIRGTTRGIIKAHRVRLEKTANVDSEIYQDAFSAEEGARIKGSMRSYDDHVAMAAPIHMHGHTAEKPVSASLYQLLDAARSAQHAHLSVAQ